jgi:2-aminobenzoate-CoA ligase
VCKGVASMKDVYPAYPTVPGDYLVPPEFQPEYQDMSGILSTGRANVTEHIVRGEGGRASQVAIVWSGQDLPLTFGDLDTRSARLANGLRARGVMPGERVAFRSPNRPEAIITALACWRLGAIIVPLPPQARPAELRFLLEDTTPTVVVALATGSMFADLAAAIIGTNLRLKLAFGGPPEDDGWESWEELVAGGAPTFANEAVPENALALIWHTGGTTGVPKACYHTQKRFLAAGKSFAQATGVGPGQRWAAAAPIGHALGFIYHTIFTLLSGATAVLIEEFNKPDVILRAITEHRVDTLTAIAATWDAMRLALGDDPSLDRIPSLQHAYAMWQSASSSEVHAFWRGRRIELLNNFGSTAFANWILVPRSGEGFATGSLGRATPGYQVVAIDPDSRVVEPLNSGELGRMAVRGPTGLTYWNRPGEQRRDVSDGWTLVDDLISIDDAGYATYAGRTDFIISSSGYKIAPVEVEMVLARHADVREVAVLGTPDPIRQEVVTAFVAVRDGVVADDALRLRLQEFVKSELAPFKYPRLIEFVDALPRDPVGKVLPRILRARIATRDSST